METSARQLGRFIDRVLAATGADQVDIVGWSQGTMTPAYYAKFLGGAGKIHTQVSLASFWSGTTAFLSDKMIGTMEALGIPGTDFPFCSACGQYTPNGKFIRQMNSNGGPYPPNIRYINITTRYDEFIVPYTSGIRRGENATNIVLQDSCPDDVSDHVALIASRRTVRLVQDALDDGAVSSPRCEFVPPVLGG